MIPKETFLLLLHLSGFFMERKSPLQSQWSKNCFPLDHMASPAEIAMDLNIPVEP